MHAFEISVIIPAYNEELRLPRTLAATIKYLKDEPFSSEVIVVSDGSKDRTSQVAESYAKDFPALRVISFPDNRGKGFAVKEGMSAARGKYRLFMDADGAVDIDLLPQLLRQVEQGYDVVIGSRALDESVLLQRQPFPRELLAHCFGYLQRFILQLKIVDTQCGFKLFTAECSEILFPLLTLDCAYFDAEVLYLACNLGYRIAEVPVVWTHDNETRLPVGWKRALDIVGKLFRIKGVHARTLGNAFIRPNGATAGESRTSLPSTR